MCFFFLENKQKVNGFKEYLKFDTLELLSCLRY